MKRKLSESYEAIHQRFRRKHGLAQKCESCGRERKEGDTYNQIQWSCKFGTPSMERDTWQELCAKCHVKYDIEILGRYVNPIFLPRTHCKNGHEFTDENSYVCRSGKSCRKCNKLRRRRCAIKENIKNNRGYLTQVEYIDELKKLNKLLNL